MNGLKAQSNKLKLNNCNRAKLMKKTEKQMPTAEITRLYHSLWRSLRKWVNQAFRKKDDNDDSPFGTPFAIF